MGSMILVLNDIQAAMALELGMAEGRDFVRQQRADPIVAPPPPKPRARVRKLLASYRARLNARRKDKHFEADVRKWASKLTPEQAQKAIDEFRKLEPKR